MPSSAAVKTSSNPQRLQAALSRRLGWDWMDQHRRSIFIARWSVVGSLTMASWKLIAALVTSVAWFWLANAAFSLGLALAKGLTIGLPGSRQLTDHPDRARRIHRTAGAAVLLLAIAYMWACTTLLGTDRAMPTYDRVVAIGIATLAFGELALAVHGVVSARRTSDLVVETIKWSNLAGGLVLLVLTQTALLSLNDEGRIGHWTGVSGIMFGGLAAIIGLGMLVRRIQTAGDPAR